MKRFLLPLLLAASSVQAAPLDEVVCADYRYRAPPEYVDQARHDVEAASANPGAERLLLADALGRLSDAYAGVFDNDDAQLAVQDAYAIWSAATPETQLAEKLHASGAASLAKGHCVTARPLLQAALEMSEKLNGANDGRTLSVLHDLLRVAVASKDAAAADRIAPRLLAAWDKAGAPDAADRLALYRNLALLYIKFEQYAKAEPLSQRGLELAKAKRPADAAQVRQMRALLAGVYYGQLRYAEGEAALPRQAQRYDPKTMAHKAVEAEMIAKTRAGDLRGALELGEQMLAGDRAEFGSSAAPYLGARLAETLDIVGELHHALNELAQAEQMYDEALTLFATHAPAHPATLTRTQTDLAILYRTRGEPARALPLQQEAMRAMLDQLGPDHPDVRESEAELARIRKALGNQ